MDAACAQLGARAKARAGNERAEHERKVAACAEREGSAKGPEPKPSAEMPGPDEQINLTDDAARLMGKSKREGCTQRYTARHHNLWKAMASLSQNTMTGSKQRAGRGLHFHPARF